MSSDTFPDALAAGLGLPPKSITRSAEPQLKSHIPWASYHTSDVYSRHAAVLQDEELILAPSSSSSPTGRPYWLSERLFGGSSNSGGYDARLSDQPGPPPTNFATNATLIIGAHHPDQPYFRSLLRFPFLTPSLVLYLCAGMLIVLLTTLFSFSRSRRRQAAKSPHARASQRRGRRSREEQWPSFSVELDQGAARHPRSRCADSPRRAV